MRTKTAYRQSNPDIPPDDFPEAIPESKINGEPALVEAVTETPPEPAPEAVAQAEQAAAEADLSAYALKKQIDDMRRAAQIQEQQRLEYQRVQLASQLMSREEKLDLWQQQGMSDREAAFLRQHERMIDHPQVAALAANEAIAQGIEKDSSDYWRAVEEGFDKHMNRLRAKAEAREPTPKFFAPPPAPPPRKASTAIYSAPVSREVPSSTPKPLDPRRVDLSVEEQLIAKASGLTLREYAEGKLRLMKEKAEGTRQ